MSKYTTEIRYICEHNAGLLKSKGFNTVDEIITNSAPKIFNFDFPIFDENYRLPLEVKILRTYYTREICEETLGLWKLRLATRLNNIMPYYNLLYKSALLEFNPFYDTDLTTIQDKSGTTDSTNNNETKIDTDSVQSGTQKFNNVKDTTEHGKTTTYKPSDFKVTTDTLEKNSDTPQSTVENLKDGKYLSNATDTHTDTVQSGKYSNTNSGKDISTKTGNIKTDNTRTDTTKNTSTNTLHINNIDNYLTKVQGKQSSISYSTLLKEYRETFLNIDNMVIEELKDLFFNLW